MRGNYMTQNNNLQYEIKYTQLDDRTFEAISNNPLNIRYASDDLRDEADLALLCVLKCGLSLRYLSPKLRDNFYIVLTAIKNNPMSIQYASDRIKDTYDIGLIAVTLNPMAFQHLSDRCQALPLIASMNNSLHNVDSKYITLSNFSTFQGN